MNGHNQGNLEYFTWKYGRVFSVSTTVLITMKQMETIATI